MHIVVNGNSHDLQDPFTLGQLLKELGIEAGRVAIMVNDGIVPKAGRENAVLIKDDRVEILTFIGGG